MPLPSPEGCGLISFMLSTWLGNPGHPLIYTSSPEGCGLVHSWSLENLRWWDEGMRGSKKWGVGVSWREPQWMMVHFALTSFFTLLILPQPNASSENQGDKTAPIDNYSLNDDESGPTITTSTRQVQPTTTMMTLMDAAQWQQWQVQLATGIGWQFSLWARMKCLQLWPNAACQAHPISSPNCPVIPALHKWSSFIVSPTWCWCGESLSPTPSKPCPALPLPSMSLGSLCCLNFREGGQIQALKMW